MIQANRLKAELQTSSFFQCVAMRHGEPFHINYATAQSEGRKIFNLMLFAP